MRSFEDGLDKVLLVASQKSITSDFINHQCSFGVLNRCVTLKQVNQELTVTSSPWFLDELSIVDLTYITHIERMCASVAYWSGKQIRGSRWPAIERWMVAFEAMPSYMATKSDYYTHVMDIPPQYGPGYSLPGSEKFAGVIGEIEVFELAFVQECRMVEWNSHDLLLHST